MTEWTLPSATRHIPDEELHAYLDQALSRSQCVEIECHLAECSRCESARNLVAAVRDRTTALLAEAGPTRVMVAPPFERLTAIHRERVAARRRWFVGAKRIGIAAAAVLAIGAGWLGRGMFSPAPATGAAVSVLPTVAVNPPADDRAAAIVLQPVAPPAEPSSARTLVAAGPVQLADEHSASEPEVSPSGSHRPSVSRAARASSTVPIVTEQATLVTTSAAGDDGYALDGLWQSIDWHQALAETNGTLPRVTGLPVNDVQVQRSGNGERPLVVVTQGYPSGAIVRTVEGPMERVEALLEREAARAGGKLRASLPVLTPPDYLGDGAAGARRGLRIFAVMGSMPTDSLNSIARGIDLRR